MKQSICNWVKKATDFINGPELPKEAYMMMYAFTVPIPETESIRKLKSMVNQLSHWENSGDKDMAKKHWHLIAEYCTEIDNNV
jgi:hypothetical protein